MEQLKPRKRRAFVNKWGFRAADHPGVKPYLGSKGRLKDSDSYFTPLKNHDPSKRTAGNGTRW